MQRPVGVPCVDAAAAERDADGAHVVAEHLAELVGRRPCRCRRRGRRSWRPRTSCWRPSRRSSPPPSRAPGRARRHDRCRSGHRALDQAVLDEERVGRRGRSRRRARCRSRRRRSRARRPDRHDHGAGRTASSSDTSRHASAGTISPCLTYAADAHRLCAVARSVPAAHGRPARPLRPRARARSSPRRRFDGEVAIQLDVEHADAGWCSTPSSSTIAACTRRRRPTRPGRSTRRPSACS